MEIGMKGYGLGKRHPGLGRQHAGIMQLHAEEFARDLGNRHAFSVCHRISTRR
jgi:hypothetical protein